MGLFGDTTKNTTTTIQNTTTNISQSGLSGGDLNAFASIIGNAFSETLGASSLAPYGGALPFAGGSSGGTIAKDGGPTFFKDPKQLATIAISGLIAVFLIFRK